MWPQSEETLQLLRDADDGNPHAVNRLMNRHRDNRMVRRKGRVFIINKKNPRFKARQG